MHDQSQAWLSRRALCAQQVLIKSSVSQRLGNRSKYKGQETGCNTINLKIFMWNYGRPEISRGLRIWPGSLAVLVEMPILPKWQWIATDKLSNGPEGLLTPYSEYVRTWMGSVVPFTQDNAIGLPVKIRLSITTYGSIIALACDTPHIPWQRSIAWSARCAGTSTFGQKPWWPRN